jgi:hypothetical protein
MREFIGLIPAPRPARQKLALVIASDVQPVPRHQELRRFKWQQRPRQAVPEIDDGIDPTSCEIAHDRFERGQVPVNVSDDGNPHGKS